MKSLLHGLRILARRYFRYRLYRKTAPQATKSTNFDYHGFSQPNGQIQTGNHHKVRE